MSAPDRGRPAGCTGLTGTRRSWQGDRKLAYGRFAMSKLMVASAAILAFGIASAGAAEEDFKQMETMTTAEFVALCRNSTAEQKCTTMLNWVRKDANARRGSCVADSVTPTQLRLSIVPELES